MTVDHHQDKASPRFPRGLALLSLTSVLLLIYVCQPNESDTPSAIETHPRPSRSSAARENRWADTLSAIDADVDSKTLEKLRAKLTAEISITDVASIMDELRNAGLGMHESTRSLLRRWAKTDGSAAAAWAERLPAGVLRENSLSIVTIEWANTDLNATAEWARKLPDATEQQTLLLAAANEAVRTDPVAALRLAVEFPETTEGGETIRRAAMEWASQDAAGAMEWAKTIPDEALRHTVLAVEMVAWSDTAPEAAATHALESLPEGRLLDDTLVAIVQRWAQTDAPTAAAWVERFPESSLRTAAIDNLLRQSITNALQKNEYSLPIRIPKDPANSNDEFIPQQ